MTDREPICHTCRPPRLPKCVESTEAVAPAEGEVAILARCAVCLRRYPLAEVSLHTPAEVDLFMEQTWETRMAEQLEAMRRMVRERDLEQHVQALQTNPDGPHWLSSPAD